MFYGVRLLASRPTLLLSHPCLGPAMAEFTERMGMIKGRKGRRTEEPFWKRRIKRNIETWRKDLCKLEEVRKGNMRLKQRERERLNRKYQLEERGTLYVSDMLKQKIKAGGVK